MASTARHLELVPQVEPSTDFPTVEEAEHDRAWIWVLALVVVGALVIASVGYVIGRSSAPLPTACVRALDRAEVAFTDALAQLGTIEDGTLAVIDGERPEMYSVLGDARLGQAELQQLRTSFVTAAEACRSG